LTIDFTCEACRDGVQLTISQHKGATLIQWREVDVEKTYTRDWIHKYYLRGEAVGNEHTPIPPDADEKGEWEVFDTSKDYKTGWRRVRW
jgi:hypothetical protein